MRELVREIVNVLSDLSVIAEGRTQAFDSPQISRGESDNYGDRPIGPSKSDYDRRLEALIAWLDESKAALTRARKTPPQKDWRTWVIEHYEGEHYTAVAVEENVHPTYIRKIRVEARRSPIDGSKKLEAA